MQATRRELDDRKGVPLWHRIEGILRHKILTGEYAVGASLPSESSLAAEYGVSRLTIREAIRGLRVEGIVQQIQGKGTFVRYVPEVGSVAGLTTGWVGPFELNVAFPALSPDPSQKVPTYSVIEIRTIDAPADIRSRLNLQETTVVSLERILISQGAPLAYILDYLPHAIGDRISHEMLTRTWLTQVLTTNLHIAILEARQIIQATVADATLGERLDVAFGSPLLASECIYFGEDNAPLYLAKVWHRADRFRYAANFRMEKPMAPEDHAPFHQSEIGAVAAEGV